MKDQEVIEQAWMFSHVIERFPWKVYVCMGCESPIAEPSEQTEVSFVEFRREREGLGNGTSIIVINGYFKDTKHCVWKSPIAGTS
jgi:hypothetical protein